MSTCDTTEASANAAGARSTDASVAGAAEPHAAHAAKVTASSARAGAGTQRSVLLLDDGELDGVERTLKELGFDCQRLQGGQIHSSVRQPRDLLVTSMKRALAMPLVEIPTGSTTWPAWVCVHGKDFLPLRARLRGLGVHFLIHSVLDEESLRLFLLQLLYSGVERRKSARLPLGAEVGLQVESNTRPVKLVELTAESCRIVSTSPIERGAAVRVSLPPFVGGGGDVELRGRADRASLSRSPAGALLYSTVVQLASLDRRGSALLDRIVTGKQLGTLVSPLAGRLEAFDLPEDEFEEAMDLRRAKPAKPAERSTPEPRERRGQPRCEYRRRVELLELSHSSTDGSSLGHDLSIDGIRVVGYPELEAGAEVTLALYAGRREEPLVVSACVVRGRDDEVAFRFAKLSRSEKLQLEQLTIGLAALESLEDDDGRVVITKVMEKVEKQAVAAGFPKRPRAKRSTAPARTSRRARAGSR